MIFLVWNDFVTGSSVALYSSTQFLFMTVQPKTFKLLSLQRQSSF